MTKIYCDIPAAPAVDKSSNKRKADDEAEHKQVVISNVEFAMMQFYKSQWEAQQAFTQQLSNENKRLKRDCDHLTVVRNQMRQQIIDLQTDVSDLRDINQWNSAQLQSTKLQLRIADEEIDNLHFQLNLARYAIQRGTPILGDEDTEPDEDSESELPSTSTFGGF